MHFLIKRKVEEGLSELLLCWNVVDRMVDAVFYFSCRYQCCYVSALLCDVVAQHSSSVFSPSVSERFICELFASV